MLHNIKLCISCTCMLEDNFSLKADCCSVTIQRHFWDLTLKAPIIMALTAFWIIFNFSKKIRHDIHVNHLSDKMSSFISQKKKLYNLSAAVMTGVLWLRGYTHHKSCVNNIICQYVVSLFWKLWVLKHFRITVFSRVWIILTIQSTYRA